MHPTALTIPYAGQAIFRYAGLDIRVVPGSDDQPWFSLADVYAALGMAPSTTVAQKLHDRESLNFAVVQVSDGSTDIITTVDAPGIVYLCMIAERFRTCVDAHVFQRWVFRTPMRVTRQVQHRGPVGVQVEFQFPQSHAAAVELADLLERDQ